MTILTRRQFGKLIAGSTVALTVADCSSEAPLPAAVLDQGVALPAARIVLKPGESTAAVSPFLFGTGIEWTDRGNGVCDSKGELRADVIDALRPLRITSVRFPGGILADHYHWRDGVGPQDRRPTRANPMDNKSHPNTFGTDEYIRFIQALGAEALVTANAGSGTFDELDAWRQYFEAQKAPVRFWELGNEIYLAEPKTRATIPGNDKRIYHTGTEYAALARDWAARLRRADPHVIVGGIAGTTNTSKENRDWLKTLIAGAAGELDFVALHNSFAPLIFGRYDFGDDHRREAAYLAMFAQAMAAGEDSARVTEEWNAAKGRPARIAVTEHFPLFGGGGGDVLEILDQSRTMASALYTASLFHAWMRAGVWMANYNLTISQWFGALVTDTPEGLIRTPTYHVYDLYRNTFGERRFRVTATGPAFATQAIGTVAARADVPYLDVEAARTADGAPVVSVINRRLTGPMTATLEGLDDGPVEVVTLAADAAAAINGPSLSKTVQARADIQPRRSRWTSRSGAEYVFPPNSLTMLRWPRR